MDYDTYKLYKLIFKNKLLSKHIYKIVRGVNRQITNSDLNNKSFLRRAKYSEANFDWCIKNQHYQLIYDKIKIGTIFNKDELTYDNLISFIQKFKIKGAEEEEIKILNQFFSINRNSLLNLKFSNKETNFIEIGILPFAIHTQNYQFFKIIYNGIKELSPSKSNLEIAEINKTSNGDLLELAMKFGNIQIIDMVHKSELNIGFNLKINNLEKLLSYTLSSNNRDKVFEYLSNNTNSGYDGDINSIKTRSYLFSNKLKLNFTNLKQLYKNYGFLLKFDKNEHISFSKVIANKIIENDNNDYTNTPDNIINFLQSSLFILSKQDKSNTNDEIIKKSNQLLNKINHLLEFNNSNEEFLIQIYKEQLVVEEPIKESKPKSSSSASFKLKIGNIFSGSNKSKNSKDNDDKESDRKNKIKSNEIVYKEFNLKREIYRLFIFDYLKFIIGYESLSIDLINLLIGDFSSQYNEYHLIINELLDNELDGRTFKLCSSLISISFKNLDSKLIDFIPIIFNCSSLKPHLNLKPISSNSTSALSITSPSTLPTIFSFKLPKSEEIYKQIELIKSFFKLDFTFISKNKADKLASEISHLKSFFKNNGDLINEEQAVEIANLIIESNKSKLISPSIFKYSFKLFKYYYTNHNQLFQWNSKEIGIKVIKTNSLELIQFIHENDIGSLNLQYSIYCSNTRETAEFMYNELGYRFCNGEFDCPLDKISKLDDWKSNYLYYFSINKIIESLKNDTTFKIEIGNSWKSNFNHWRFIRSSGILEMNILRKDDIISKFNDSFALFNNINFIISMTGNIYSIKRFTKDINSGNHLKFTLKLTYQSKEKLKTESKLDLVLLNKFITK